MTQPREPDGAAAAGAARYHQALPGRDGQRRTSASPSRPGEIHALLGENGAGKSHAGQDHLRRAAAPTRARSLWDGEPVAIADAQGRRAALGIGMVFQHFSLFEAHDRAREHRAGLDEAVDREALNAPRSPTILASLRPAARSRPRGPHALGRRAPAHRDRPLPAAEAEAPDHGRADLGADAAGGRHAVRDAAPARRRRLLDPLHQPQAARDQRALRARHHPARRARSWRLRPAQVETRERMAELMIGAELRKPHAPRRRRRPAPRLERRRASVCRREPPFGTDLKEHQLRGAAPARSSASPGSPATARTSCCWRSPASCLAERAERSRSTACRSASSGAARAGARSACLRARGAQRPRRRAAT